MNTKIIFGAICAALVAGGLFLFFTSPKADTQQASVSQSGAGTTDTTSAGVQASTSTEVPGANTGSSGTGAASSSGYTMAKVALHSSASSCWSAINGKVYDLTAWIDQHPGGPERILAICGLDGSSSFNGQHGGQRRPESELAGYLLGNLSN